MEATEPGVLQVEDKDELEAVFVEDLEDVPALQEDVKVFENELNKF